MYARATGQTNLRETASFLFFVLRPQPTCGFLPSTFVAPTQSPRMQDVRAAPHADDAVLRNMSLLLGLTGSPGYQVDAASSPTFTSRMTLETAELARRRAMEGPPVVIVVNLPSSPPRTNLSPQRSRATYQEQGTLRPDDGIADYARDFMGSLSATLATASSATTAGAAAAGANTVAATASLAAMPAAGPTQAPRFHGAKGSPRMVQWVVRSPRASGSGRNHPVFGPPQPRTTCNSELIFIKASSGRLRLACRQPSSGSLVRLVLRGCVCQDYNST